ncbi:MAG: signal recognition particle protein [Candidatus Aenigmarchaeota archaeon]|nr:signal recognition particle protein [Candidatus Aenigmarchaeota archaeon]
MVLENLGSGLKDALRRIAGLGVVDKEAVDAVVRDLQRSLLQADADVALVADLSSRIRKQVLGSPPPAGMTLKEHFLKVLYDELVAFLGAERGEVQLRKQRILLVGLFGSGKTTLSGKLAKWFKTRGLSVGLVGCDVHRPAAQEQLRQVGKKVEARVVAEGTDAVAVAKTGLAMKEDVLIFDSAGRDALDADLAKELKTLGQEIKPDEVLLVLPADIGQAARKQAEEFNRLVGITGVVITKLDGTAKGGGALAATNATGAKVKFIGVGERPEDLEAYDPQRFVSRLIGYGDLQGLLEKAKEAGADKVGKRLLEGSFTLDDFFDQLQSMQGMGSLSKMVDMIPGLSKAKIPKGMLDVQEGKMKKWKFTIQSMTPAERADPDLIKASRIVRIAKGSGTSEADVRELLKYYKQAKQVVKLAKGGKGLKRGPLANIARQFGMTG